MASAPVLYLCADGFCVLLLLFLFLKARASLFVGNHELFVRVLLSNCVLLLTDTLFALFDYQGVGAFLALDRVNCAANFILSGVAGLTWFHYAEAELGVRLSEKPAAIRLLTAAPALLLTILTLVSLRTGWLFTVGSEGFRRGPLYVLQPILAWGYTVSPSAHAIVRGRRTKNFAEKMRCRSLASRRSMRYSRSVSATGRPFFSTVLRSVSMRSGPTERTAFASVDCLPPYTQ